MLFHAPRTVKNTPQQGCSNFRYTLHIVRQIQKCKGAEAQLCNISVGSPPFTGRAKHSCTTGRRKLAGVASFAARGTKWRRGHVRGYFVSPATIVGFVLFICAFAVDTREHRLCYVSAFRKPACSLDDVVAGVVLRARCSCLAVLLSKTRDVDERTNEGREEGK